MFKKNGPKTLLTKEEEFHIFRMILDKFLWIGTIAILYGLFLLLNPNADSGLGMLILGIGLFFMLLFTSILARNLEWKKN